MLKKVFTALLLAVTLIFVSTQDNIAEAREVYVGSYSDGTNVYLLTETIRQVGGGRWCSCRVRAGRDYLNYDFSRNGGNPTYENSEGYRGHVYDGRSPVALAIWNYIQHGNW